MGKLAEEDSKYRIFKETFPSEIISIIGSLSAGIILTILILPFESFPILILMIPAVLSLRGNISSPFCARVSKDLILGEFDLRSLGENVLATLFLSLISSLIIGILSYMVNIFLVSFPLLSFGHFLLIPIISLIINLGISIPVTIILNYVAFKSGLNPNNVLPLITSIGDLLSVLSFFFSLIILNIP